VFDFGLCKSLAPFLKNKDSHGNEAYGYMLTPRTGSVPYMAPEGTKDETQGKRPFLSTSHIHSSLSTALLQLRNARYVLAVIVLSLLVKRIISRLFSSPMTASAMFFRLSF